MVLIFGLLLTSSQSYAEDYYWFGGTGAWDDASNWNPNGIPTYPDSVYLTNAPDTSSTAYLNIIHVVQIENVQIYGTGQGTMTLVSDSGLWTLRGPVTIGSNGVLTQTGGSLAGLSNGVFVETGGTYNLIAGSRSSNLGCIYVSGEVNQTGGSAREEGTNVNTGGVYNISGTGVLGAEHSISIANGGVLNQKGGTVSPERGSLDVSGTYNLAAGDLFGPMGGEYITGVFNQSGGTHTYSSYYQPLFVNSGGTYSLSGGRLEAHGIDVGGRFNYSGGELVLGYQNS